MTKTKPETDFIIVRPKRENHPSGSFSLWRNREDIDMTGYAYLKTNENGLEVWVHEDDYSFYHKKMHKHDDIKDWCGSEDHKNFVKEMEQ